MLQLQGGETHVVERILVQLLPAGVLLECPVVQQLLRPP